MTRARRSGHDHGAAAVEFALVAPLLFLLLFGIIDYGFLFADSISVRQGVRDGARAGVVARWGSATCPAPGHAAGASANIRQLACTTAQGVQPLSGRVYVRIRVMNAAGTADTTSWTYGNTLRVCVMHKHDSFLPLVPIPNGGISRARVDMAIEQSTTPLQVEVGGSDTPPAGTDWTSWC